MQIITLNGKWVLNKTGEKEKISAVVPGSVHTDLLAEAIIDEPFYRDNEKDIMWIGETDWDYSREFAINKETLEFEKILLRCNGLDTLATIYINGQEIGKSNNMYRS